MGRAEDWDAVRALYARLERGEELEFSDDVRDLCQRVARDLAIRDDDAENSLLTSSGAATLVREMRRRIFDGSRRLSRAFVDAGRRQEAGDVNGARELLEGVLAIEVVPLYREQAQIALAALDETE